MYEDDDSGDKGRVTVEMEPKQTRAFDPAKLKESEAFMQVCI